MSVTNEAATAVGAGTRRGNFLIWLAALGIVAAGAVAVDTVMSDRGEAPSVGVQGVEAQDLGLTRGQQAEASRLSGIAGVYEQSAQAPVLGGTASQQAQADRFGAMPDRSQLPTIGGTAAQQAQADRLGARPGSDAGGPSMAAQIAASERLKGLAEHYGAAVESEPSTFEFFGPLAPYAESSDLGGIEWNGYGLPDF